MVHVYSYRRAVYIVHLKIFFDPNSGCNYSLSNTSTMGIWSDVLGSVHMWPSPISWHQCNVSDEDTEEWRETGQTQQLRLLSGNVS